MPTLRNGRLLDEDAWVFAEDGTALEAALAAGRPVAPPLALYLARSETGETLPGVRLDPDDDALALAPRLARLQLVAIAFPRFADGRGYSQARLLRARLGFCGEIRAIGDVRVDQLPFMLRVGIDAFAFAEAPAPALVERALARYTTSYQRSYTLPLAG